MQDDQRDVPGQPRLPRQPQKDENLHTFDGIFANCSIGSW